MTPTQSAIVACARGWIGTRFAHQGRLKKTTADAGGVDCLGLLIGIARDLDLQAASGQALASMDHMHYGHNPEKYLLHDGLSDALDPVGLNELKAGDIVLCTLEKHPQHLAIVSDYPNGGLGLIHAYAPARAVVEHRLDESWKQRITAAFRFAY